MFIALSWPAKDKFYVMLYATAFVARPVCAWHHLRDTRIAQYSLKSFTSVLCAGLGLASTRRYDSSCCISSILQVPDSNSIC